ncbi:b(0,+)-type amino acid transporter 1-like [Ruditapes philippinarum]|uniref:b(0,+)-type amino acid transporter 1-like n=1 Tax=Ruditapes philippinarum TaxID=129788 RepID=UPI00295B8BAB|nr:b(0,+)-type amino acid transporter 1-like [Ruditapes philippinarum]
MDKVKSKSQPMNQSDNESVIIDVAKPKVHISLFGAVTFGMGSMIGSGIFISPAGTLHNSGSIGMSLIMWTFCGLLSLLFALVYGELGSLLPHSGGDFSYINKSLGRVPAFLVVWTVPLFSNTASLAVLSLVFANYLLAFLFQSCTPSIAMTKLVAATMVLTLGVTNTWSAKLGAYTQIVCTVVKVTALLLISLGGIVFLCQGKVHNFDNSFQGSATDVTSYTLAIYNCMFAYGGFSRIGEIAEEIHNPQRNIYKAVLISVISVTFIYVMTNISFFTLLPKASFLTSSAVAYDWALDGFKPVAFLVPLCVIVSVYGASNSNSFGSSRILFSAARAGHFPEVMSFLNVNSSVPVISVMIIHGIALVLLIPGNIGTLINFLNFLIFIMMMLTSISLLNIRYEQRNEPKDGDKFRSPIIVPILSTLFCIFLIVTPFVSSPQVEFLYGIAIVAVGFFIYIPFVHFELKVPGIDTVTMIFQLICNIRPVEKSL